MPTPAMEDYLEQIYRLIETKGYARPVDIAARLKVTSPTVTKMIQRLHESGFVRYEKYRDVILTAKGKKIGQSTVRKHEILEEFFRILRVDDEVACLEIEQIEHYIGQQTSCRIASLVQFLKEHPPIYQSFLQHLLIRHAPPDKRLPDPSE